MLCVLGNCGIPWAIGDFSWTDEHWVACDGCKIKQDGVWVLYPGRMAVKKFFSELVEVYCELDQHDYSILMNSTSEGVDGWLR